ncbi:YceI family protein [Chitinophaga defluvii]|uniref:YceI family protein n=1 Tax=Chitinophaga defluvii TaxID=3163343 RepID=A0ABV2T6K3_9BACT
MRNFIVLIIAICGLTACQEAPKADKAKVTDAQIVETGTGHPYVVDTLTSRVAWVGTKPTGKHQGYFKLLKGTIYVKDSAINGGKFIINMHSLEDTDLAADPAMKVKLENELKGNLFFDVDKYPEATFEITSVTTFRPAVGDEILMKDATHTIQGNLTMKDVIKNIAFPAKISINASEILASATFNMDRTLWGMTYRADKSLQDKLINSMVNITFTIKAAR